MDFAGPTAALPPAFSSLAATTGLAKPDPLRAAAEEFESVFLSTVLSRMFESLPVDGPFGGGHAEATYRSFLADEYAKELAREGGIGIADEVHAELLRIQEARRP